MSIVKVAGIWEIGWNTPLAEADLWQFPLMDFGVDQWYMTPVSGIDRQEVTEVKELTQVIEHNPDLTVVFVDEKAPTPLKEFTHPPNALYILGRTSVNAMKLYQRPQDLAVSIETKPDHSNSGILWAHQAISIVLYDRLIKTKR
jgi:hypothetical protein